MRPSTEFFKNLVGNKPVNILELGVADGKNAWILRNHFNCKRLWLIDLWCQTYKPVVNEWVISTFKKFDTDKKTVIIKGNAVHVSDIIPDNSLDYIYIDDLHAKAHVLKEIELYLPKLKVGGVMGFHDFDLSLEGRVAAAVLEYRKTNEMELYTEDLDCWWIKK